ncbi:MAG TPA: RodZ domain-containing protein [Bryobacteraceae bacterium]
MLSIGDRLRRERLQRGLDIDQLAELTKINSAMLEAIEADDLDRLPGSFFTRSFVRQYAKALDLDDDDFETELRRVTGADEPPPDELPAFTPDLGLPPVTPGVGSYRRGHHSLGALIAFVLIVAGCTGIYALWQKTRNIAPAERSPAAAAPGAGKAQRTTPPPAPAAAQPVPAAGTAVPEPAPAKPETAAPQPPPSETAGQPTPAAQPGPVETPAPATKLASSLPPGETAGVRVQVRANGEAWISVVSDGKNLYSGVLAPGADRVFEGKERMSIRFGDPAAVEATWNGKAVGAIGPQGKPRTVQFTPGDFRILSPAPPAPPDSGDGL